MEIQTILSVYEARKLSNVSDLTCDIQDISQIEQREARLKLGQDFYDELIADLVNYSGAVEWAPGTHAIDTVVIYQGFLYKATVETANEPPHADWELAPKFTDACFEELYCRFLGRYLALNVLKNSRVPQRAMTEAQGIVVKKGNDFDPVTDKTFEILQRHDATQVSMVFENMDAWICEHNSEGDCKGKFDKYLGVMGKCCRTCKKLMPFCECEDTHITRQKRRTFRIG